MLRWFACAIVAATVACARAGDRETADVMAVDDFGDTLRLSAAPARIVSLTPASTELLFALGAGPRLVGRTRWDDWPDSARLVPDLGDGIRPNVEVVLAARPDLVILYGSEENRAAARRMRAAGVATLSVRVDLVEHFEKFAILLGRVLHDSARAQTVVDSVLGSMNAVRESTRGLPRLRTVWLADLDPLIVIGGGSFLSGLIDVAGGANVFADTPTPSAAVSAEAVLARDPQVIVSSRLLADRLRSEDLWRATSAGRGNRIVVAESQLLGRPSVRMGEAAAHLARLIHPELQR
jgi:ABC-type Fe3+-hydroxamate transport system substrate-binding protein